MRLLISFMLHGRLALLWGRNTVSESSLCPHSLMAFCMCSRVLKYASFVMVVFVLEASVCQTLRKLSPNSPRMLSSLSLLSAPFWIFLAMVRSLFSKLKFIKFALPKLALAFPRPSHVEPKWALTLKQYRLLLYHLAVKRYITYRISHCSSVRGPVQMNRFCL